MEITDIINRIYRLPQPSLDVFVRSVAEVEYPKKFRLFQQGRKEKKAYFIKQGFARAYTEKDGKEVTFWFGAEGDALVSFPTLFDRLEYANTELLEDSILYEIEVARLQELYATDIHLSTWGRRFAEYACIHSEKQFIARQFKTSLERYEELTAECPDITQRVPLGIIASYLGISQVNLSRIRAKAK